MSFCLYTNTSFSFPNKVSSTSSSSLSSKYVNVLPVNPKKMVKIGLKIQKKANGKYAKVDTPRTVVINTPHTLQGTSGFTTVPASSETRARFKLLSPTFLYCEA